MNVPDTVAVLDGERPPTVAVVTVTPDADAVALAGPLALTLVMLRVAVAVPPETARRSDSFSSIIVSIWRSPF